jgi:hypothetical protein
MVARAWVRARAAGLSARTSYEPRRSTIDAWGRVVLLLNADGPALSVRYPTVRAQFKPRWLIRDLDCRRADILPRKIRG